LSRGVSKRNVSQIIPSIICCNPKRSGIAANGSSAFRPAFLTVIAPIASRDVPAMKLAETEKHNYLCSRCK